MGGGVIAHSTKRQTVVACEATEAELLPLDSCMKRVLFVKHLLVELGLERSLPVPVMCDSSAPCSITEVGYFSSRT